MRKKISFIFVIFLFFTGNLLGYNWPVKIFTSQHGINATLGEWRSGHFHAGIDINAGQGDSVFAVDSGIVILGDPNPAKNYWVGDFRYIHINFEVSNEDTLGPGNFIGLVDNPTAPHVHFREKTTLSLPYNAINPLLPGALTLYVDSTNPHIDSIKVYRQASDSLMTGILDNRVDILSVAGDMRTDSTGHIPTIPGNVSVYRIGYEVKDTLGGVVKSYWEKIVFDIIDNPSSTSQQSLTYGSGSTNTNFRYWVSNDPFNSNSNLRNWYWNTRQKINEPDSVDADSIEDALFKDGNYWVKVLVYDIRDNADSESVYVQVANFRPRVKETDPEDGQGNVPIHKDIYVRFSEVMDTVLTPNSNLWSVIGISPGVSGDWKWLSDTTIEFTPDPAFVENTTYTVSLSSQLKDMQGQELIPYAFSFTTEESDDYECYPVAFQWENVSYWDVSVSWFDNYYTFQIFWDFMFPFYGYYYDMIIFNRRGSIWFDTNRDWCHFDLPTAGGSGVPVMAVYNDSLRHLFGHYSRGASAELFNPNREVVRWTYTYYADTTEFEAVLFADGTIRFDYRKCDIDTFFDNDGGSGVSKGDSIHYAIVPGPVYELALASFIFTTGQPPPGKPRDPDASWPIRSEFVNFTWRENPEPDLQGYNVYRRRGDSLIYAKLGFTTVNNFIDTLIELGNTYIYRVSALDESDLESPYSDSVMVEYGPRTTNDSLATAYNNGRKIISNADGDKVHFVYSADGVYYCYSSDSGESFSTSEYIGPGLYPSIALNTAGKPCASWISDSILYYSYLNTYWTSANIVMPVELSQPSMIVDAFDTVHMVLCRYGIQGSNYGDLLYLKFHRTNFEDMVIETLLVNDFCRTPSLAKGFSDDINILWQGENCLCYRSKDATGWSEIDTIYTTTSNEALYPVLDIYGSTITAVWQDKDVLDDLQIYSRMKHDSGWETINQVGSTTGDSRYPSLAGVHHCLWQDNTLGNWEVYKSEYIGATGTWAAPENISNSSTASTYPHGFCTLINGMARLYALWTEGDESPFAVKVYALTFTPSGYVLNLDSFPLYEAEEPHNQMCGPAVAQMALNYMFWDNITNPEGPPMLPEFAQDSLYEYGITHNSDPELEYFDLQGMWHTIQDKKPMPYSEYGYNFTKRHNTDQYTMLKLICQWIDYTVGTYGGHEEGHPYHVPSIVPAYGDYTNWMAIRGIHTDVSAYPMPDTLIIYGFWVNDPLSGGIGANTYKLIGTWSTDYYKAMTVGAYIGEYLGIFEPPESTEGCKLILAQPTPRFTEEQKEQLKRIVGSDKIPAYMRDWIVQAAMDGVTKELIPYDENFKKVFKMTTPGKPFFVKNIYGNDYFAVPFNLASLDISEPLPVPETKPIPEDKPIPFPTNKPISKDISRIKPVSQIRPTLKAEPTLEVGPISDVKPISRPKPVSKKEPTPKTRYKPIETKAKTTVVVLIDAKDGSFREASWTDNPVKYLPISRTDAQRIALKIVQEMGFIVKEIYPKLVHRNSTPYYPEWRVIIEEEGIAIYISQDGEITIEDLKGGIGGVMSSGVGNTPFIYSLKPISPNPFANNAVINFSIAKPGYVSLNVYDISGRLIKTLIKEKKDAGIHSVKWNGQNNNNKKVAAGIYFTRLKSGSFTSVKKVILVR